MPQGWGPECPVLADSSGEVGGGLLGLWGLQVSPRRKDLAATSNVAPTETGPRFGTCARGITQLLPGERWGCRKGVHRGRLLHGWREPLGLWENLRFGACIQQVSVEFPSWSDCQGA